MDEQDPAVKTLWYAVLGVHPLVVTTEDGFIDIDLPMVASARDPKDGAFLAKAYGYDDDLAPCGFLIRIQATSNKRVNIGTFVSTGAPSDHFVALLERLYGLPPSGKPMAPGVPVHVISPEANEDQLGRSVVHTKLFFCPYASEGPCAELFLNINPEAGTIEFDEKDNEYRAALVRALTEVPPGSHASASG